MVIKTTWRALIRVPCADSKVSGVLKHHTYLFIIQSYQRNILWGIWFSSLVVFTLSLYLRNMYISVTAFRSNTLLLCHWNIWFLFNGYYLRWVYSWRYNSRWCRKSICHHPWTETLPWKAAWTASTTSTLPKAFMEDYFMYSQSMSIIWSVIFTKYLLFWPQMNHFSLQLESDFIIMKTSRTMEY